MMNSVGFTVQCWRATAVPGWPQTRAQASQPGNGKMRQSTPGTQLQLGMTHLDHPAHPLLPADSAGARHGTAFSGIGVTIGESELPEIGRASCRERVAIWVVAG